MSFGNRWLGRALACLAVAALVLSFAPSTSAGCSGTMYIYYETAAMATETGAKLVCPTGVHYDPGPNGTFQQTPFFVTLTMNCPCSGGIGGGEDQEEGG